MEQNVSAPASDDGLYELVEESPPLPRTTSQTIPSAATPGQPPDAEGSPAGANAEPAAKAPGKVGKAIAAAVRKKRRRRRARRAMRRRGGSHWPCTSSC